MGRGSSSKMDIFVAELLHKVHKWCVGKMIMIFVFGDEALVWRVNVLLGNEPQSNVCVMLQQNIYGTPVPIVMQNSSEGKIEKN